MKTVMMEAMKEKTQQKVYRPLALGVVEALLGIFVEKRYADKVIEGVLRQDKRRGSRDRAFIAEMVYDIVRYKRLYKMLGGISQLHDAQDCWHVLGVGLLLKGYDLPAWEEFAQVSPRKVFELYDSANLERKIAQSIPDWLDETGMAELPSIWDQEIVALNRQASVVLRVNTLRTDIATLEKLLAGEGIDTVRIEGYPDALELVERKNVFQSECFKKGFFEVQDASSQRVAALLDPQPGMRVIDACAGAGGKSLHLAALMKNKGSLISMDIEPFKLAELHRRAARAGVSNVTTRVIEGSKTIKRLAGSADRLLLDVPCSGLGVLRRNPDAKWKLKPEFLDNIRSTQYEILSSYSKMLKVGGLMVYATCSIFPSENENQVKKFIASNPEFELLESRPVFASVDGYDGFYMALLTRTLKGE